MMYYAAFVPGLQRVVADIVRTRLSDVRIDKLLDGAVVFETQCTYDRLNFFCFNNIFAVISIVENFPREGAPEAHIRAAGKAAGRQGRNPVIAENSKKIRSFRVVCSEENRPASMDERIREKLERFIAGQSRLGVNRSSPDTEFWILYRREGFSVFMKRLTKHPSFEKILRPGELPPPLAYMLCWLSGPKPAEVVVDPFCGCGSILEERQKHFPPALFCASDIDGKVLALARRRIRGSLSSCCRIQRADIRSIFSVVPEGTADAVITDPPWGEYAELPVSPGRFYGDMAGIFGRLLKPGGTAVVLTARIGELQAGVEESGILEPGEIFPVLVSGRKAAVFRFVKHHDDGKARRIKGSWNIAEQGSC
jgi:SAM-dependent methyltransferase